MSASKNTSSDALPATAPRRGFYLAAAFLSLVGLADSIYLTIERLAGHAVRCTITNGCNEVLGSAYATIMGVPLSALGALAYFTVFSLAILTAFGYQTARALLFYLVALMLLFTIWLFILQAFVLHAFCQFCLLSAAITFLLAALVAADRYYLRRTSPNKLH